MKREEKKEMLKEEINSRERGLPFAFPLCAFACAFLLLTQEK
jgi:hypothetical protein